MLDWVVFKLLEFLDPADGVLSIWLFWELNMDACFFVWTEPTERPGLYSAPWHTILCLVLPVNVATVHVGINLGKCCCLISGLPGAQSYEAAVVWGSLH